MARGITRFRINVDGALGSQDRTLLGELIIERMLDRTERGEDIEGRSFRRYSANYIDWLRKIGASTTVDLSLTGEMLASIRVLSHGTGFIDIGIEAGTFASEKARWQQGGNPNVPSRPFMGIRDDEARSLENEVASNSTMVQAQRFLEENNAIDRIFASIVGDSFNG